MTLRAECLKMALQIEEAEPSGVPIHEVVNALESFAGHSEDHKAVLEMAVERRAIHHTPARVLARAEEFLNMMRPPPPPKPEPRVQATQPRGRRRKGSSR